MLPIPTTGQLELFTISRTHEKDVTILFSMALVDVRAPPGVVRATENCFALTRPEPSKAVIILTRTIAGPQEIEFEVLTEIYKNNTFLLKSFTKLTIFVD